MCSFIKDMASDSCFAALMKLRIGFLFAKSTKPPEKYALIKTHEKTHENENGAAI